MKRSKTIRKRLILAILALLSVLTLPATYLVSILLTYLAVSILVDWRWWFGIRPKVILGPPVNLPFVLLIAAHNEEDFLHETIVSGLRQTRKPTKIVVVDDSSTDRTGDVARSFENNAFGVPVEVVRTPQNKGSKAAAQNFALMQEELIDTELVVTVDADTTLKEDGIEHMLRYMNDPQTAVVCSWVAPKHIRSLWERGRFIEYLYALSVVKPAQNHHHAILVMSGCFAVFRTSVIRSLGYFSERTKGEDMDFTWELQGSGYYGYYCPEAECYPEDPSTWKIYYKQVYRWQAILLQCIMVRNLRWFWERKGFSFVILYYVVTNLLGPILSVVSFSVLWSNILYGLLSAIIMQIVFVWIPALTAAWRRGKFLKAFASIPAFIVIQYVNMGIFMHVLARELTGRKLTTFEKGHAKSVALPPNSSSKEHVNVEH